MIPEEAVEAAARRFFSKWDELPDSSKEHFYPDVRAMLEAAAPYMQAANEPQKEMSTGALIRQLLDETRTDK